MWAFRNLIMHCLQGDFWVITTVIGNIFLKKYVALKRAVCCRWEERLTSESVESPALSLQSVDNVHGGHCLPLGVLGVGDGITDDVLEEHLQDTTGLLVDET